MFQIHIYINIMCKYSDIIKKYLCNISKYKYIKKVKTIG